MEGTGWSLHGFSKGTETYSSFDWRSPRRGAPPFSLLKSCTSVNALCLSHSLSSQCNSIVDFIDGAGIVVVRVHEPIVLHVGHTAAVGS